MTEVDEKKEKFIMEAYLEVLKISGVPAVSLVLSRLKDLIERNAYDLIYEGITNSLSEGEVHATLSKYRCIHTYYGSHQYDAQNVLFPNWLYHLKLLRGG